MPLIKTCLGYKNRKSKDPFFRTVKFGGNMMRVEQFDENKKSAIFVCSSGGGYGWGEIYYDSETGKWYEHSYHCGSVDLAETHDDGVSEIKDKLYVVSEMIKKNAIPELLQFYDELGVKNLLSDVLKEVQRSHYGCLEKSGFKEITYYKYYRFHNGDYAIYFSGKYYCLGRDGKFWADCSVVSRIINEQNTVSYYQYDFSNKTWAHFSLAKNMWKNTPEPEFAESVKRRTISCDDSLDSFCFQKQRGKIEKKAEDDAGYLKKKKSFFSKFFYK